MGLRYLTYIYVAKFSFLRIVQTGSGAHPACYSMGTVAFPGGKAVRA
jgi:hypothetical protein